MRSAGIAVLLGAVALAGLSLIVWLLGLILGIGGALIHLLLLLAMLVGPAGAVAGIVLILVGRSRNPQS